MSLCVRASLVADVDADADDVAPSSPGALARALSFPLNDAGAGADAGADGYSDDLDGDDTNNPLCRAFSICDRVRARSDGRNASK